MGVDKKFSIETTFDNSIIYLWVKNLKCAKEEVRMEARREGKEIKDYILKQL